MHEVFNLFFGELRVFRPGSKARGAKQENRCPQPEVSAKRCHGAPRLVAMKIYTCTLRPSRESYKDKVDDRISIVSFALRAATAHYPGAEGEVLMASGTGETVVRAGQGGAKRNLVPDLTRGEV